MKHLSASAARLACTPLALACLVATGAMFSTGSLAADLKRIETAQLQSMFWDCDAVSLTQVMTAGDGALCVAVSDTLKQRLFDGDFARLLAWWRLHKAAERARRGAPGASSSTASAG